MPLFAAWFRRRKGIRKGRLVAYESQRKRKCRPSRNPGQDPVFAVMTEPELRNGKQ